MLALSGEWASRLLRGGVMGGLGGCWGVALN